MNVVLEPSGLDTLLEEKRLGSHTQQFMHLTQNIQCLKKKIIMLQTETGSLRKILESFFSFCRDFLWPNDTCTHLCIEAQLEWASGNGSAQDRHSH